MFIGREKELLDMNERYSENRFHLFILYGRRRVGKTTLLKEFCKGKSAIFYSAEQSNEKINLEKFSSQVFTYYEEEHLEPFTTWENAFTYIHVKQQDNPLVLVIDEFPYLADINPALLSILQHLIDHKLQEGKLFLVLCGSYVGFMEREVLGAKSPLFGRRTAQLHMKSFDYQTSSLFLKSYSLEEQLMLYGAFGGTAMYLQQIQTDKTVKENIVRIFLTPTGYLYEEPLLLMRQEVKEPGIYYAIIEAIATGATKANEIAMKVGEDSSKCLKYISILRQLGIIYKERPFGEKESSRKAIYQISDFMFCFWYRYVSSNKTLLEMDAVDIVWKRRIEPDFSHYMGLVFEKICKDYLLKQNSKGFLPILFTEIGRWWGSDKVTKKQIEIDLVAKGESEYLFCECKWRNELCDVGVLRGLEDKAMLFGEKSKKNYFIIFSKSGFTNTLIEEKMKRDDLELISLTELLQ